MNFLKEIQHLQKIKMHSISQSGLRLKFNHFAVFANLSSIENSKLNLKFKAKDEIFFRLDFIFQYSIHTNLNFYFFLL